MRPIEDIISEKAYSELTEQELLEVAELATNEEEYNQMRRFFESFATEVQSGYSFEASPAVKESLDGIFMAKHPVIAQDWNKENEVAQAPVIPLYKRRSVQIAAVLLLCLGAAPLLFQQENTTFDLKEKDSSLAKKEAAIKSHEETSSVNSTALSDAKDLPNGVTTNDDHATLTASATWADIPADDKSSKMSDDEIPEKFSMSEGLKADLDPNLGGTPFTVTGNAADRTKSVTAVASGSEMLDWIQAAY